MKPTEEDLSERRRRQIFLALVKAQDMGVSVAESRKAIAKQFNVTEGLVGTVEQEGIDGQWPPLSKAP